MSAKLTPRTDAARADERAGAARIEAAFGWDRIADRTADVYAAVIARSGMAVDAGASEKGKAATNRVMG